MHILGCCLIWTAGAVTAFAHAASTGGSTSEYPVQAFAARGVDRIEISGVRGSVRLRGSSGSAYRLRVRHRIAVDRDDWGLSVERRGGALVVEVFSTALGKEWQPLLRKDRWPTFDIEMTGPAKPLVVGWRQGTVDVRQWPASVDAAMTGGEVTVAGAGAVKVQITNGNVTATDVAGAAEVHGGHGALSLARIRGNTQVDWFSGSVALSQLTGNLALHSERASVNARGGRGRWDLTLAAGAVAIDDFDGRLNGRGQSTDWRIGAREPAWVAITNGDGPVAVKLPASARASIETRAGLIHAPWATGLRDGWRVAEGRVGATVARLLARVFVRTSRGSVRLTH